MKTKTSKTTNYVLLFMLVILLTTLSSAETYNLGTIKKDSCIEIPQVCLSCSYLKINIQYPNKTFAVVNQDMALKNSSTGLWSYYFCNTSELGKYEISGVGDLDGVDTGFSSMWFEVEGGDMKLFMFLLCISLVFLLFSFLFQSNWLSFSSGLLMAISGVYVMIYGLGYISDLYTRSIAYTLVGLGLFFTIVSSYSILENY